MGETATYLLPYPELDEADNVPEDVRALADRLELVLPTFEEVARYGQPNGYAPLGADGRVPGAYLPTPASQTIVVRKVTTKDVVNIATPVDLFNGEAVIPPNALTVNGRLYGVCGGSYLNNTGGNKTLTLGLYFAPIGTESIWISNTFTVGASGNRRAWRFVFEIMPFDSTHVLATCFFAMGGTITPPTGTGSVDSGSAGYYGAGDQNSLTLAQAVGTGRTMSFACTHSVTSAQLSMRLDHFRLEIAT